MVILKERSAGAYVPRVGGNRAVGVRNLRKKGAAKFLHALDQVKVQPLAFAYEKATAVWETAHVESDH